MTVRRARNKGIEVRRMQNILNVYMQMFTLEGTFNEMFSVYILKESGRSEDFIIFQVAKDMVLNFRID